MVDLDVIASRADAATPGPWYADGWALFDDSSGEYEGLYEYGANAQFIAHAREDIPALLAEIHRLKSEDNLSSKIEAVTAELEYALMYLHGTCCLCKNNPEKHGQGKCINCKFDYYPHECAVDNWEFAGPRKKVNDASELDHLKQEVNDYCTAFLARSIYGECKAFCPFYETQLSEIPKCSSKYIETHPEEIRKILNCAHSL